MTNSEGIWMTRKAYIGLQMELAALRTGRRTRQARIHQIEELLANAVVGENPSDDGIAEPGMALTVRYDDTGETETFLLGLRGVEDADIEVYSPQSPLGSAIIGARAGERLTYPTVSGANASVTLLKAVPYHSSSAA